MVKKLRPSPEAFRRAGWYPKSQKAYDDFMHDLTVKCFATMKQGDDALLPHIKTFKHYVLTTPTVYQEFVRMFQQIDKGSSPGSFDELIHMYNTIFRTAPYFGDLGPPLYMIMNRIMNTQGGFSAFTKTLLNEQFKKMFVTWSDFLLSGASTYVLTNQEIPDTHFVGWFHKNAMDEMMKKFPGRTFAQVYLCDPDHKDGHYGFTSFDDFFNRRFRCVQIDRPIPHDDKPPHNGIVVAPCEAAFYDLQHDVQLQNDFFIKDEAYSLNQLLFNDPLTEEFIGGSVVQGFLQTPDYHRWHSPVNGTVVKIVDVPGTYFNQAPSTLGEIIPPIDDNKNLPPYLKSLTYFAHTNARKLFFIRADNEKIGLICFIAIGMTEISTCVNTVFDGQVLKQGDELGLFRFGGSSFVMAFTGKACEHIDFSQKYQTIKPMTPILINEEVARVRDE